MFYFLYGSETCLHQRWSFFQPIREFFSEPDHQKLADSAADFTAVIEWQFATESRNLTTLEISKCRLQDSVEYHIYIYIYIHMYPCWIRGTGYPDSLRDILHYIILTLV